MTNIDVDDKVYEEWVEFYNFNDKLKYPTLKNFTARKLKELIDKAGKKNARKK